MKRPHIVTKIKTIVKQTVPKAEIILFGSEARGDARPDSGIDILILVDDEKVSYDRLHAISSPLYEFGIMNEVEISPIIMSKKEWNTRPFLTPFYCNIINEGILL